MTGPSHSQYADTMRAARRVKRVLQRASMPDLEQPISDLCRLAALLWVRNQQLTEERDAMWLRLKREKDEE